MKVFGYLAAWLLMPLLAIRHKLLRVTHYEIECESLSTQKHGDYIQASQAFSTLIASERYGDFIILFEFRKNKDPKIIQRLRW